MAATKLPTLGEGLDFRLLGPLEVRRAGHLLPAGAPKQVALLAALLLHANQPVSIVRLAECLWDDDPPTDPSRVIQVYVSGLRKLLRGPGAGDPLVTRRPGYLLCVADGQLDLDRFRRLAALGQAALATGDAAGAARLLHAATELWHGSALADVGSGVLQRTAVPRLEEEHLAALEGRIEADLALGHPGLAAELTALTAAHPLRERLHGLLMIALYRAGRQADALSTYRELQRHLGDELGLTPGPWLRRLELGILRGDPTLDPAVPAGR